MMNPNRTLLVRRAGCVALALAASLAASTTPARADDARPSAPPGAAAPGEDLAGALADAWPDRPEWLDMYTDILRGSQLGPDDGWFRRAKAQTRFGWDAVR